MPQLLADQAGIAELAVSLTHEGDVAAAVVVALCGPGTDSTEPAGIPVDETDDCDGAY